jgi:endoglycosylceramidase
LPGVAGKTNLLPLYDRVHAKIREVDKDTIIMYEPVTWGIMSNEEAWGTGFDHAPGNDIAGTSLAWHYYCWIINVDPDPLRNDSLPQFIRGICDDWQLPLYFETVRNDLNRIGGGTSFITEFGSCNFNDPVTGQLNLDECDSIMSAADKNFVPWTYWASDFYSKNFRLLDEYLFVFGRVYPTATNGIPISLAYNSTTRVFAYSFEMNVSSKKQASLNTEIFLPYYLYYRSDFKVTLSSNLKWTFDFDTTKVLIALNDSVLENFESMKKSGALSTVSTVLIEPKF